MAVVSPVRVSDGISLILPFMEVMTERGEKRESWNKLNDKGKKSHIGLVIPLAFKGVEM